MSLEGKPTFPAALLVAAALTASLPSSGAQAFDPPAGWNDRAPSLTVFGGVMTDQSAGRFLSSPLNMTFLRSGLTGVSLEVPLGAAAEFRLGSLQMGIEAQIVRHSGLQLHWEFNLPITLRWRSTTPYFGMVDGLGLGIGPSHATRAPVVEASRHRSGFSARSIVYWHIELEHRPTRTPGTSAFWRLHHRSDAFETFGPGGSSNVLAMGLRFSM